jgi:hypothetical protein
MTNTKTSAIYTDHGRDFNAKGMRFHETEVTLAPISDRAKEFWKRMGGGESTCATFSKTGGYDLISKFLSEGMNFYTIPIAID